MENSEKNDRSEKQDAETFGAPMSTYSFLIITIFPIL